MYPYRKAVENSPGVLHTNSSLMPLIHSKKLFLTRFSPLFYINSHKKYFILNVRRASIFDYWTTKSFWCLFLFTRYYVCVALAISFAFAYISWLLFRGNIDAHFFLNSNSFLSFASIYRMIKKNQKVSVFLKHKKRDGCMKLVTQEMWNSKLMRSQPAGKMFSHFNMRKIVLSNRKLFNRLLN